MKGVLVKYAGIWILPAYLLSLIVGSAPPAALLAQHRHDDRTVRFEHLTVTDGLSQNIVTTILQDRHGFMWFGTQSGLNRYDGYDVRVYKHDPDMPGSLSHNWVMGLLEDRNGTLWVGTFGGGLNRFDPATETFTHYRHDPVKGSGLSHDFVGPILEDRYGMLWLGTEGGGVNRFDPTSETFTNFKHDPDDPTSLRDPTNAVRTLYEDHEGHLWLGTWGGGLSRFRRETQTFEHFTLNSGNAPPTVLALHEDRHKNLWVATEHAGFNLVDRLNGKITPVAPFGREKPAPTSIGSLYEDRDGHLWLGTWGQGLCHFDPATNATTCYRHDPYNPFSLSDNGVGSIYEDRSGVLWVSTRSGLSRIDLRTAGVAGFQYDPYRPSSLSDRDVRTIYVDRSGTTWAGTWHGGLNRLDPKTGRFRHYRYEAHTPRSLSSDNVQSILEDHDGVLWVGTWGGGLNRFDEANERFTRFEYDPNDPGSLHSNSVLEIYEDRHGVLWIGTWDGLTRLGPDRKTFQRIRDESQARSSPGHIEVWSIYEDHEGVLWVGTRNNGLGRLDRDRDMLTFFSHDPEDPYSIGHNTVWAIHEDSAGVLWIATGGGGLNRYDREIGRFERFTTRKSSIPDNVVYSIVQDESGMLWLGTEKGLSRFDPTSSRFTHYDERPDLRSCGFSTAAFYRDGVIYVGCDNGFVTFRPDEIRENVHPPAVVLTDLKIFGTSVKPGAKGPFKGPLYDTREVVLHYNENDLTFSFVALHFANPAYNRYAYMLDNYDPDWREAGMQRSATYAHLSPGKYVFRVKAANSDGIWNEVGTSVLVTILPPWWFTGIAYFAYGLVFVGLLVIAERHHRRRIVRKEREASILRENELRAAAAEARALSLQLEYERQTHWLEQARSVQLSMLPRVVPQYPYAAVAASMQTATEVGGDYYDFSLTPDGALTFVIGDATGHGARASTMVTAMKSLWHAFSSESDLETLLSRSSKVLRQLRLPKLYMALAVGRLKGRSLELIGAGMPPALIFRSVTGEMDQVPLKGLPLATAYEFPHRRRCATLAPDDVVVLMSDGFPELFNASGEMLGYERAVEIVAATVPGRSPNEIADLLMKQATEWRGGQPPNDDVTFIVLKATAAALPPGEFGRYSP